MKNVVVLGDNRTVQDYNLYDTNKQTALAQSNYLVNRIIKELPSSTNHAAADYTMFSGRVLDHIIQNNYHIIAHADQTFRDPRLTEIVDELMNLGLTVWNGSLQDISKRKVDEVAKAMGLLPLGVDKDYEGLVFTKTDFNAGDVPQDLQSYQYKVLDAKDVPDELWNDSRMFISAYVDPSLDKNSKYGRVERVYFSGDEAFVISIFGSDKSEIKSDNVMRLYYRPIEKREQDLDFLVGEGIKKPGFSFGFVDEYQQRAYDATRLIQKKLGIDVGAIEYLIDKDHNKLRLMDINYTSYTSSVGDLFTKIFANDLYAHLHKK